MEGCVMLFLYSKLLSTDWPFAFEGESLFFFIFSNTVFLIAIWGLRESSEYVQAEL